MHSYRLFLEFDLIPHTTSHRRQSNGQLLKLEVRFTVHCVHCYWWCFNHSETLFWRKELIVRPGNPPTTRRWNPGKVVKIVSAFSRLCYWKYIPFTVAIIVSLLAQTIVNFFIWFYSRKILPFIQELDSSQSNWFWKILCPPLSFIWIFFWPVLPCNQPEFHKGHRPRNVHTRTTTCATSKDIGKIFPFNFFFKTGGKIWFNGFHICWVGFFPGWRLC